MTTTNESRPAMVRHNGQVCVLHEIPAPEIAAALTPRQRAEISAKLGNQPRIGGSGKAKAGRSRLQRVADAVATDPACNGKAELALALLCDDEIASVPASGIIKLLQAAPSANSDEYDGTAELNAMLLHWREADQNAEATMPAGNHGWGKIVADVNARRGIPAHQTDREA